MNNTLYDELNYVIGFDLGHGETALMMVNLKSEHRKAEAQKITINGRSNFITAIGYHPTQGILIGDDALTTEGVERTQFAFKQRPNQDSTYQKTVADYAGYIHGKIKNAIGVTDDDALFIVGCPTDWVAKRNSHLGLGSAYEALFREKAQILKVRVVAESRGALMNALESGDITARISELRGRALVVDLGSSTADFTLIDLAHRQAEPFDFGHDLGASLIDKLIFRQLLHNSKQREALMRHFTDSSVYRYRGEFACRQAKEQWFNNPSSTPQVFVEVIPDEVEFRGRITKEVMSEILQTPLSMIQDLAAVYDQNFSNLTHRNWESELEEQLKNACREANRTVGLPDLILLTGGASRMSFVEPICKKIFPEARVFKGLEPEYAIARGLAYWGRIEIQTEQFTKDIDQFCLERIRPKVSKQIDSLYDRVANIIADNVIGIVKSAFDSWKNKNLLTVNEMKNHIDEEIQNWIGKNLSQHVSDQVRPVLAKIGSELSDDIKSLENKYAIPIGFLGASFNVFSLEAKRISVGLNSVDLTDGLADGLGNVIGVIAGLVTGVVIYIVTPIILAIIIKIIAIISINLAAMVLGILLTNPAGWIILAGIGIAAVAAGAEAKDKVKENLPNWDLPKWVRGLVKSQSIYSKIEEQHSEIVTQVTSKLSEDHNLREQVIDKIVDIYRRSLEEKSADARMLIT